MLQYDEKKDVLRNLNFVSSKIGCANEFLITLNQIHSNKIYYSVKNKKKKLKGDGILTNSKGLALGILTADCVPILFCKAFCILKFFSLY